MKVVSNVEIESKSKIIAVVAGDTAVREIMIHVGEIPK
jgi:hypothetical protein